MIISGNSLGIAHLLFDSENGLFLTQQIGNAIENAYQKVIHLISLIVNYFFRNNHPTTSSSNSQTVTSNPLLEKKIILFNFQTALSTLLPTDIDSLDRSIQKVKKIFSTEKNKQLYLSYAHEHYALHANLIRITKVFTKKEEKVKKVWRDFLREILSEICLHYPNQKIINFHTMRELIDLQNEGLSYSIDIVPTSSLTKKEQQEFLKIKEKSFSHPYHPKVDDSKFFKENKVFLAKYKNGIVGFLVYEKKDAYIDAIACSPSFACLGIGTRLLKALVDYINDKEKTTSTLRLEVRPKNPAKHLYQQLGFTKNRNAQPTPYWYPDETSIPMHASLCKVTKKIHQRCQKFIKIG